MAEAAAPRDLLPQIQQQGQQVLREGARLVSTL